MDEKARGLLSEKLGERPWITLGLTRFGGSIRVERSGSTKGVEGEQDRQALLA